MRIFLLPSRLLLIFIRIYQRIFSFDSGLFSFLFPHGFCPFQPTCSEYFYQAVGKYGLIRGCGKGLCRLLRCHPFTKGGIDPLR